ncbi:DEAD/DEAH box helicase [Geomonas sp. Red69]|uniref:DEAD/DEAH box helicase n=1 Tax=Geomonas diazotrophica TaxID=2843197 RepID=A0ABX8JMV6_9BACT|nr:DEAD/DEAH box helicase [Geomonas diazotrophica]QWV99710.1 DEAD/DEAH box helicase [Geomonas nitrogeniifigens]QXE88845.1 DEAD/DEAH box helicase [Geomonas nitrogeniifigens]
MDIMGIPLLRHLFQMPAAGIYALADKVHLFNGFELCKRKPVRGVSWHKDGSVLEVELRDAEVSCRVTLSLLQGDFSSACDCGTWSPHGRCPHLVAALATLKKALAPASFPMLQLPNDYLQGIRTALAAAPAQGVAGEEAAPITESGYALVLDRDQGALRMRLMLDQVPVALFDAALPASIREFLRLLNSSALRGRAVEEFLSRFRGRFPIFYLAPQGPLPLCFDPSLQRTVMLHLDLVDGDIHARLSLEDGVSFDGEESFIHQGYYFDLGRGLIQKVDDTATRLFAELGRRLAQTQQAGAAQEEDTLCFPAASFNEAQFDLGGGSEEELTRRVVLSRGGVPAAPLPLQPRYRLNILELAEMSSLVAEGVADGLSFSLSPTAFRFFNVAGRAVFPQPLKAKKRVAAIIKACFAALRAANLGERDRLVRQVLEGAEFFKRGVRSDARAIIGDFCQQAQQPSTMLQLSEQGEWLAVTVAVGRQGRLLELLAEHFGFDIFWQAEGAGRFSVERKVLMRQLSELKGALAAEGYALALAGEDLQTASWTFTLDATRSSIDWFELRPEIRADGELVNEAELLDALQGGGVFRRGNSLFVLDPTTCSTLALFAPHAKREVVRVPRLQILDWITLRRNGVRVLLSPEDERIFESLTRFESIPRRSPPTELQATLRNYQLDGYSWLAFLYEHRFGACLADDMGLGKTIQAIALLAGLKEGGIDSQLPPDVPHLVVVPPTLIFNWESELARFYPALKVGVYRGQGRRAEFSGFDLVLTSYGVIQRDIDVLSEIPFHVIVFDEAQAVKNIHAETTGAVRRLKGRFKVTLTGTPVENHLGEYFSVMDLALPGLLGAYEQFRRQMGREGAEFLETLIRRTHPFILRRSKDMIAAELPPKVETDIYLEMSPRQKALYARTVTEVRETVARAFSSNSAGQARIIALTAILKLRQICLCSRLVLPDAADRSPKVDFLVDQLLELFAEGHSVLVFSQFTSFLDIVQQGLTQRGIVSSRLDGTTPVARRKELVQNFQNSTEPGVFLLSLKAGGRGLNLTRASYVFHLDPWWNPAVESQASDRAHRIGQKRQVTITRLLMRHSIEEKMMELKKRKLKLYRALLEDAENEGPVAIGREDFEFLLGQG